MQKLCIKSPRAERLWGFNRSLFGCCHMMRLSTLWIILKLLWLWCSEGNDVIYLNYYKKQCGALLSVRWHRQSVKCVCLHSLIWRMVNWAAHSDGFEFKKMGKIYSCSLQGAGKTLISSLGSEKGGSGKLGKDLCALSLLKLYYSK